MVAIYVSRPSIKADAAAKEPTTPQASISHSHPGVVSLMTRIVAVEVMIRLMTSEAMRERLPLRGLFT